MPARNRVTPYGDLTAVSARGTLMGNRGILRGDDDVQQFQDTSTTRWLICRLDYVGKSSANKGTHRYTKLFFLDEATALAAGHRPCHRCQRDRAVAFRAAWNRGNTAKKVETLSELDSALHEARIEPRFRWGSGRRAYRSNSPRLPTGTIVDHAGAPYLVSGSRLLAWSPSGYGEPEALPGSEVWVITPRPTVRAIAAGYEVGMHPTAY